MKFDIRKNEKGFSFVELLVVMAIITTSMVFIFELVATNIKAQTINKNYLVASMLAQEGIELVRNSRDENWLTEVVGSPGSEVWVWDQIADPTNLPSYENKFIMDYNDGNVPTANNVLITDAAARLNFSAGFYAHDAGTATPFLRLIEIYPGTGAAPDFEYVRVVSTVQWMANGAPHQYVAETLLYDWR